MPKKPTKSKPKKAPKQPGSFVYTGPPLNVSSLPPEPEHIREGRRLIDRILAAREPALSRPVQQRKRKTRNDKGQTQLLAPDEITRAKKYYGQLLDGGQRKWRRPQTAAKHITVEFLKRPDESWQTVRDWIVIPVLEERHLTEPENDNAK